MRFFATLALLLVFAAVVASPAHASTDYRCLNMCVNGGKGSQECMAQCTYDQKKAQTKSHIDAVKPLPPDPHNTFRAPVPVAQGQAPPTVDPRLKKALALGKPQKDYACYQQCVQSGLQIKMCDEQCTGVHRTATATKLPDNTKVTPRVDANGVTTSLQ
jgi:hypothetical protein